MRVNPLEVSKLLDKKNPTAHALRHTAQDLQHGIQQKTYYTRHTAQDLLHTAYSTIRTIHGIHQDT